MAKDKLLPPVNPNCGVEAEYRRSLVALIDAMNRSVIYWLKAKYRANPPEIAQDEMPADALRKMLAELGERWTSKFDEAAKDLAEYFAKSAAERSDVALKAILKKAGFSVSFKMTAAQRDILSATVQQNVSLIKSIPTEYMTQVQGSVMRAVQVGRDLGGLAKELEEHYGVTKRRAAFISFDQNQKATSAFNRSRQLELGIEQAVWRHSGGGKHPRPTHLKAGQDKVVYDVAKGWYDPALGKYIWPGTEPHCHCTSRSVIPGFA